MAKSPVETSTPRKCSGRLILSFYDDGAGFLAPEVEFPILGNITEGKIERSLQFVYRQLRIDRAAALHKMNKEKENG